MRTHRCFCPDADESADSVTLDEEEAGHLVRVLRAKEGDAVLVLNGRGAEFSAEIAAVGKKTCEVRITGVARTAPRPPARVIAAALTKSPAFDDILQRCVELGMTAFRPIVCDYSVVELPADRAEKRLQKWRRLAIDALKQCERLWLPEFAAPVAFRDVATAAGMQAIYLVERSANAPMLSERAATLRDSDVTFVIGPEGGWSGAEREFIAAQVDAAQASLGDAVVLRTETAMLAALAAMM